MIKRLLSLVFLLHAPLVLLLLPLVALVLFIVSGVSGKASRMLSTILVLDDAQYFRVVVVDIEACRPFSRRRR